MHGRVHKMFETECQSGTGYELIVHTYCGPVRRIVYLYVQPVLTVQLVLAVQLVLTVQSVFTVHPLLIVQPILTVQPVLTVKRLHI
jgi:hypothetical protein